MHVKMLQNNINTLERMFNFVTKIHSTKRCIGTRQILSEEDEMQPNGRVFKKFKMGDYMWRNFIETEFAATCFGRGLRELGQQPRQNIVIFAETRAEWLIAAHGCFKQNMPLVTIYATLGDEGIAHGINETEVDMVITSHELLPKFKTVLGITPNVKKIIFMEDQLHKTDVTGFKEGVQIIPFSTVIEKGEKSKMGEFSLWGRVVCGGLLKKLLCLFRRLLPDAGRHGHHHVHVRIDWDAQGCAAVARQLHRHDEELLRHLQDLPGRRADWVPAVGARVRAARRECVPVDGRADRLLDAAHADRLQLEDHEGLQG